VRELRSNIDTAVEARRDRALPMQRLRVVPQDEWTKSTSHQAEATLGKPPLITFESNQLHRLSCSSRNPVFEEA
jgi:hypothetical protein